MARAYSPRRLRALPAPGQATYPNRLNRRTASSGPPGATFGAPRHAAPDPLGSRAAQRLSREFWRFAAPRLIRGDIEPVIRVGLMAIT